MSRCAFFCSGKKELGIIFENRHPSPHIKIVHMKILVLIGYFIVSNRDRSGPHGLESDVNLYLYDQLGAEKQSDCHS